ncbi:TonB family protein [Pantoea coffeiphila]|nr:TonB family protein [Pantoea coffeiphila]
MSKLRHVIASFSVMLFSCLAQVIDCFTIRDYLMHKFTLLLFCALLAACTQGNNDSRGEVPSPIAIKRPAYPANAFHQRLTGDVMLSYDVDANGNVINPVVVSDTANGAFNREALNAISGWKYEPNKPYKGMTKNIKFMINRQ